MTLTKANTTTFQVETLAKVYLKGKPAEISDETMPNSVIGSWVSSSNYP